MGAADPAALGHMFKQLDIKDNVNQNGTGFGLTITKLLIKNLGGRLIAKENKGLLA